MLKEIPLAELDQCQSSTLIKCKFWNIHQMASSLKELRNPKKSTNKKQTQSIMSLVNFKRTKSHTRGRSLILSFKRTGTCLTKWRLSQVSMIRFLPILDPDPKWIKGILISKIWSSLVATLRVQTFLITLMQLYSTMFRKD